MGQILHGDCLELLPRLVPKESIDLVLADPPYGITSAGFDCEVDLIKLWPQLWRVAKLHCPIIFTASQPFSSIVVLSQIDYFKHEWIWIKNRGSNFANTVREPMKEHEHILVFAKHKWVYNKQMQERTGGGLDRCKYTVTSRTKSENYRQFEDREPRIMSEMRVPSSWQKFNTEKGFHPQQKPIDLFRYLIRTYSNPNAIVLDMTCGSGTTAIAAMREGRRFLCIEKELRFVEIAKKRIEDENIERDIDSDKN
ncbi:MAG TPA: site-specific DNA-methyltransferase [Methylomirabilota bacterium]|nr:site-specific DNA-methyltransferase [Methylomirabilota bacterium]